MPSVAQEFLDSWEIGLSARRLSVRTIALYLACMQYFMAWLEEHDRPTDPLEVTRKDCEAYLASIRSKVSANTVRSRWVAMRVFFNWLVEEEELDVNPMTRVKAPQVPETPVPVLRTDELRKLLEQCKGKDFASRRDTAIIRTMLDAGLRLSEVTGLRRHDVDLKTRIVTVLGKGERIRVCRVGATTTAALDSYIRTRARHRYAESPALWLGTKGPMHDDGIVVMIKRRALAAGIGDIHAHQLRHTFAHRWLAAGGNEGDLQRLGGWRNPAVMRRYGSAVAVDRALAAHDDVNPMAGL